MPKSTAPKPVQNLNYEEALAELESIVSMLEEAEKPLDESMKMFERGQALVARCNELLEAAELKVKQVSGETLLPFEEDGS
jgi:exodeoxyribonuclease VII small subunit